MKNLAFGQKITFMLILLALLVLPLASLVILKPLRILPRAAAPSNMAALTSESETAQDASTQATALVNAYYWTHLTPPRLDIRFNNGKTFIPLAIGPSIEVYDASNNAYKGTLSKFCSDIKYADRTTYVMFSCTGTKEAFYAKGMPRYAKFNIPRSNIVDFNKPTPTPGPSATPKPTATPTPTIVMSHVQILALYHPGYQDMPVYRGKVKIVNHDTGQQLYYDLTDQTGKSPKRAVPKETNIDVYLYKPDDWVTLYCGEKWSFNTGPYGNLWSQNLRLNLPVTGYPCIRE